MNDPTSSGCELNDYPKGSSGSASNGDSSPVEALSRPFVVTHGASKKKGQVLTAVDESRFSFSVGTLSFLIKIDTLCQTMEVPTIYPLPNLKKWVVGATNIRGNFVPVLDIKRYLGEKVSSLDKRKLLILGQGMDSIGVLIDGYPGREVLLETQRLSQFPPLPEKIQNFITAVYEIDKKIFLEVDRDRLLLGLMRSAT